MEQKKEILTLLEESLKELEKPKGSVYMGLQKLSRASIMLENTNIQKWCQIQFGESKYTIPLEEYTKTLVDLSKESTDELEAKSKKCREKLNNLGLVENIHFPLDEINVKYHKSSGGYENINFIEEKYADLVKTKKGRSGSYYKDNLLQHIVFVQKKAQEFATKIHNNIKYSNTVINCFDLLKTEVDNKLIDLNPALGEQLMLAFKAVSSQKPEEWSQALTTCRRLLEGLADRLFPASDEKINGRTLKQNQHINRLWAFMDKSIGSSSNKDLAKAHIDLLGSWLSKINQLTNKGVHSELKQLEATKAVFHTYLVVADIIEYLDVEPKKNGKLNINTASVDELEAFLGVKRFIAIEIFKKRTNEGGSISLKLLSSIKGVGDKTLQRAQSEFEIEE